MVGVVAEEAEGEPRSARLASVIAGVKGYVARNRVLMPVRASVIRALTLRCQAADVLTSKRPATNSPYARLIRSASEVQVTSKVPVYSS